MRLFWCKCGLTARCTKIIVSGDLGENILVGGVDYRYFQVGQRYKFSSDKQPDSQQVSGDQVVIEVTEPMEPCANLCKLPYINDPSLDNAIERLSRCKDFIEAMGRNDGLRGWYAKVILGGLIQVGDSISSIAGTNQDQHMTSSIEL